jgi:hypothetical protein
MADKTAAEQLYDIWSVLKAEGNCTDYIDEMCSQLTLLGTESNSLTKQAIHDKLEKVLTKIKANL